MRWMNLRQQYVGMWQKGVQVLQSARACFLSPCLARWCPGLEISIFFKWFVLESQAASLFRAAWPRNSLLEHKSRGRAAFLPQQPLRRRVCAGPETRTRESLLRQRRQLWRRVAKQRKPFQGTGFTTGTTEAQKAPLSHDVTYNWHRPCGAGKIHERRQARFWRGPCVRSNNGALPEVEQRAQPSKR